MEARTLEQLLADCREELGDETAPYFWTDEVLVKYLNEAVAEAAIRARLLVESSRQDICRINVTAGVAEYTLHPTVVVIREALLGIAHTPPLKRTTAGHLNRFHRGWRDEAPGTPQFILRDRQQRRITLVPTPDTDTTLMLTVWRTPADDEVMEVGENDAEPVIDPMYHQHLFRWAVFRALMRRETEQRSTADAEAQLAIFERIFGPAPTAAQLQDLQIDSLGGSAAVWF